MGYIVRMPKLGLEMETGVLLEWTVAEGDTVAEGEVVAEVESEKSIGEVDARETGVLRRTYLEEGGKVPPATPIGIIAAADADISELEAEAEADLAGDAGGETEEAEPEPAAATAAGAETEGAAQESATEGGAGAAAGDGEPAGKVSPRARKRADELDVDLGTVEGTGYQGAVTAEDVEAAAASAGAEEVKASPRARERAEELDVDLATVEGTGFEGSVTEEDVEAAAESQASEAGAAAAEPARARRRTGAQRVAPMSAAADRYDRVTAVAAPAAGEALFETTEAVRTAFEQRVTMTDVLVVVTTAALGDAPALNGTYAESTHHVRADCHVALVAAADGSEATGVIPDAADRSLGEVVEARQSIEGSGAGPEATFTLANGAETEDDGRLVNPPAVAALEVDPTRQRSVPDDGVDLQPLVTAALTYDTRAIGNREAAAFLERLFERLEQAPELVLGSYRGRE